MIVNKHGCKMDSSELRSLCIKNNWFTAGDVKQYEKLFIALEENAPLDTLATIIWICSSNTCRRDIKYEFEQAGFKEVEA